MLLILEGKRSLQIDGSIIKFLVLGCWAPKPWHVVVAIIHAPDKRCYILDICHTFNISMNYVPVIHKYFSDDFCHTVHHFPSDINLIDICFVFFAIFSPNSYMTCSMPAIIYAPYKSSPNVTSDPRWAHGSQEVMDVTGAMVRLTASYVSTEVFRRRLQTYITWRTRSALDSGDG